MTFRGLLVTESFIAFARHRAGRLDLAIEFGDTGPDAIDVMIGGQDVLVDAFEMACSLGPRDCIVRDVERYDAA